MTITIDISDGNVNDLMVAMGQPLTEKYTPELVGIGVYKYLQRRLTDLLQSRALEQAVASARKVTL